MTGTYKRYTRESSPTFDEQPLTVRDAVLLRGFVRAHRQPEHHHHAGNETRQVEDCGPATLHIRPRTKVAGRRQDEESA